MFQEWLQQRSRGQVKLDTEFHGRLGIVVGAAAAAALIVSTKSPNPTASGGAFIVSIDRQLLL